MDHQTLRAAVSRLDYEIDEVATEYCEQSESADWGVASEIRQRLRHLHGEKLALTSMLEKADAAQRRRDFRDPWLLYDALKIWFYITLFVAACLVITFFLHVYPRMSVVYLP